MESQQNSAEGIVRQYVNDRYASRRSMVRYMYHRALSPFGMYARYSKPDWEQVERVVFVCMGNICRSPYAEFVARESGIDAVSCGLSTRGADPANPVATKTAADRSIDLTAHRSSKFGSGEFTSKDLLVCMEASQAKALEDYRVADGFQLALLGMFCSPRVPHIPDPYNKTDAYFRRCFDWIDEGVATIVAGLNQSGRLAKDA